MHNYMSVQAAVQRAVVRCIYTILVIIAPVNGPCSTQRAKNDDAEHVLMDFFLRYFVRENAYPHNITTFYAHTTSQQTVVFST